jgi:hypothetical protein
MPYTGFGAERSSKKSRRYRRLFLNWCTGSEFDRLGLLGEAAEGRGRVLEVEDDAVAVVFRIAVAQIRIGVQMCFFASKRSSGTAVPATRTHLPAAKPQISTFGLATICL